MVRYVRWVTGSAGGTVQFDAELLSCSPFGADTRKSRNRSTRRLHDGLGRTTWSQGKITHVTITFYPKDDDATIRSSGPSGRSEEHTSELQSLMRISYAVFCLKKKTTNRQLTNYYIMQNTKHKNK